MILFITSHLLVLIVPSSRYCMAARIKSQTIVSYVQLNSGAVNYCSTENYFTGSFACKEHLKQT